MTKMLRHPAITGWRSYQRSYLQGREAADVPVPAPTKCSPADIAAPLFGGRHSQTQANAEGVGAFAQLEVIRLIVPISSEPPICSTDARCPFHRNPLRPGGSAYRASRSRGRCGFWCARGSRAWFCSPEQLGRIGGPRGGGDGLGRDRAALDPVCSPTGRTSVRAHVARSV